MSVIICTPVYNGIEVLPRFLGAYGTQIPEGIVFYHLFVTNNCTDGSNLMIDGYIRDVFPRARRISWDYPKDFTMRVGNPYAAIAIARQRLIKETREIMFRFPYTTHVLMTDDDTIPMHDDAVETAVAWNVDILGGSYLRHWPNGDTALASRWLGPDGRPFSYTEIAEPLMEPYVTSGGFLLLSRKVIMDKRLNWWPIFDDRSEPHPQSADDFGFCLGARRAGYRIFLDGLIRLEHLWRKRDRPWVKDERGYLPFEFQTPSGMSGTGGKIELSKKDEGGRIHALKNPNVNEPAGIAACPSAHRANHVLEEAV